MRLSDGFLTRTLPLLFLIGICAGALRVRLADPYDVVFTRDEVVLRSNDPWYHLRLTENLARHPLHRLTFDPYALAPNGQDIGYAPLLDVIGVILLRLGAGITGLALLPAIAGAAIAVPAFLIGRQMFGAWPALLAAAIVAFAPGQFTSISMVGFYDHHVLEVLFSTLFAMLWIRVMQCGEGAVWAGVVLGLYLLSWQGGVIFLAIVLVSLAAQRLFDPARDFGPPGVLMLASALVTLLPFTVYGMVVGRSAIAVAAALAGFAAMRATPNRGLALVPPVVALGVMASGLFQAAHEHVSLRDYFTRGPNVWEIRPLLFSTGHFSFHPAYEEFGLAAWLILPGLAIVAWRWYRDGRSPELGFFLLWSCAWLGATFMMRRHAYYFIVNVGLLAAACFELLGRRWRWPALGASAVLVFLAIGPATKQAGGAAGPPFDWRESLEWMRTNTPEPFGLADAYYQVSGHAAGGYGVMVWGAEGFWVTGIAHRIPSDNPTWFGSREAAAFYLERDEQAAARLLERLKVRYVIAPFSVPLQEGPGGATAYGELAVMANWIGRDRNELVEQFEFPGGRRKLLYYPAYFEMMATRLCVFGGRAVEASRVGVVVADGGRRVTSYEEFATLSAAQAAVAAHPGARIVSKDPMRSCVPLAGLSRYSLVHHSPSPEMSVEAYEVQIYAFR